MKSRSHLWFKQSVAFGLCACFSVVLFRTLTTSQAMASNATEFGNEYAVLNGDVSHQFRIASGDRVGQEGVADWHDDAASQGGQAGLHDEDDFVQVYDANRKHSREAHAQNKRDELPTNMSEEGVVSGSFPPAQAKVSSPEPASKHQAMIMKPTLRTIVISDAAKSWTHDMWNDSASRHRFPLEINNSVNLSSYRGYLIERCKANATIDAYMQGLII